MDTRHSSVTVIEDMHRFATGRRLPVAVAAVLAVALGWQLAALVSALRGTAVDDATVEVAVTAPDPQSAATADDPAQSAFGLFGEFRDNGDAVAAPVDAPDTRLDLVLRGVFTLGDGGGFAYIVAGRGDEARYARGDDLPGGARLERIHADRVLLRRDGSLETLRLDRTDGTALLAAPAGATAGMAAARDLRQRMMQNPAEIMRMVQLQPHEQDGRLLGFRLQARGEMERILHSFGLTGDDVLVSVNGMALDNLGDVETVLAELRSARVIEVEYLRDGQRRSLNIPVEPGSGT